MTDEEKAEKYASNSMKEWHGMSYIGTEFAEIKIKQAWQAGYEQGIRADVHTDNSAVIAQLTEENAQLKADLEEAWMHCKAVDDVNAKLRCCRNCKHYPAKTCQYADVCSADYDRWEMKE